MIELTLPRLSEICLPVLTIRSALYLRPIHKKAGGRADMTDQNSSDQQTGEQQEGGAQGSSSEKQSGDPGRTPGTAEGDEETVEESLRQKEA
jgi:hypothetical protein